MTAIAPDTNLVITITSRRWLTVLQELRGEALVITPTVRTQVRDRISDLTDRAMRIRFKRHPPASTRIAQAARMAAMQADDEWWENEQRRNDSAYTFIRFSAEEQRRVEIERMRLPSEAFTDTNGYDRRILAEAVVAGATLVSSHNMGSIDHELITKMAHEGQCADVKIATPVKTLDTLYKGIRHDADEALRMSLVASAIGVTRAATSDDWYEDIAGFVRSWQDLERNIPIGRQLARRAEEVCAATTPRHWDHIRSRVLMHFPERARQSENRYHALREELMRETGYAP